MQVYETRRDDLSAGVDRSSDSLWAIRPDRENRDAIATNSDRPKTTGGAAAVDDRSTLNQEVA